MRNKHLSAILSRTLIGHRVIVNNKSNSTRGYFALLAFEYLIVDGKTPSPFHLLHIGFYLLIHHFWGGTGV
jgi:hypothetical protein